MLKQTPLKRKARLQPLSKKMLEQLNAQVPVRIALCNRALGRPEIHETSIGFSNGVRGKLQTVICIGGFCEICHRRGEVLDPHEKFLRSRGGKVSLENSIVICRACHNRQHGTG